MSPSLCVNPLAAVEVHDDAAIERIWQFRADVWTREQGVAAGAFPDGRWRDDFDRVARHWIVRDEQGRLIGAGRLTIHDSLDGVHEAFQYQRYGLQITGLVAAPDRVVVCPTARRRGVAAMLLDAQDRAACAVGARFAVRQASDGMARLVARRGWQLLGPALPDPRFPGVPFTVAVKQFDH